MDYRREVFTDIEFLSLFLHIVLFCSVSFSFWLSEESDLGTAAHLLTPECPWVVFTDNHTLVLGLLLQKALLFCTKIYLLMPRANSEDCCWSTVKSVCICGTTWGQAFRMALRENFEDDGAKQSHKWWRVAWLHQLHWLQKTTQKG